MGVASGEISQLEPNVLALDTIIGIEFQLHWIGVNAFSMQIVRLLALEIRLRGLEGFAFCDLGHSMGKSMNMTAIRGTY